MDHHVAMILAAVDQEGMEKQRQQQQQQLVCERGRRIKAAAELGLARSSSSRGRQWGRALGRRALAVAPTKDDDSYPFELETMAASTRGDHQAQKEAAALPEEEEEEVEEKVALLRRLVPGGEDMAVDGLLEETADYIAALKAQVGVMRALACLLSGSGLDDLTEKPAAAGGRLTPEKPRCQ